MHSDTRCGRFNQDGWVGWWGPSRVWEEGARGGRRGAFRSQMGRLRGGCGAVGSAAHSVAMQSRRIPPIIDPERPDPECDLDYVPEAGRKKGIEHAVRN